MKKLVISFGTRPEFIKILPVFHELVACYGRDRILLLDTGQHRDLLKRELNFFKVTPDFTLSLNRTNGSLSELTGKLLLEFDKFTKICSTEKIEIAAVIAQGDTASTYISALHSFHHQIPFFHIEAGLRTFDKLNPFPEEFYRRSISEMASIHFAPTQSEFDYLVQEGNKPCDISVTGNTVIDNLVDLQRGNISNEVLITLHRRELKPSEIDRIIAHFKQLIPASPDWKFNLVSHPNGKVDFNELSQFPNFSILQPLTFFEMLEMYRTVGLIFTDSGGIQEEAAFLGIPCVICRSTTERSLGIKTGIAAFLDVEAASLPEVMRSFNLDELKSQNTIYGDGKSSKRIVEIINSKIP